MDFKILVIGMAFSLCVSTVMIVLGIDKLESFSVGLLGVVISALIHIIERLQKIKETINRNGLLINKVTKYPDLIDVIDKILDNFHQININHAPAQAIQRAKTKFENLKEELHKMTLGAYTIDSPQQTAKKIVESLENAGKGDIIRAISYINTITFWRSEGGKKIQEICIEAVKRGAKITRIFIGSKNEIKELEPILKQQKVGGIEILVADEECLDSNWKKDYLIVNEEILMITEDNYRENFTSEVVNWNKSEIKNALEVFEILKTNSSPNL
jgi:hypothetical protein